MVYKRLSIKILSVAHEYGTCKFRNVVLPILPPQWKNTVMYFMQSLPSIQELSSKNLVQISCNAFVYSRGPHEVLLNL